MLIGLELEEEDSVGGSIVPDLAKDFSGICEVEYSIGEAQKNRGPSTRVALLLFGTLMRECTISRGEDQHRPEKDVDTRSKEEEQQQQRWR